MPDKYVPIEEVEFVDIEFNRLFPVKVPKFLHDYHGWWDYWELDCHLSMAKHLKPGMSLYDVGAFDGWQSAVFARMVGGEQNIVLVEPVPEMWANTKLTWEKNGLGAPYASFMGFAADYNSLNCTVMMRDWPRGPDYSKIIKAIKFRLLHEHADHTDAMTLDSMAYITGAPKALHIDVEGAELRVLRGATNLLRTHHPLVWVAVHPLFMQERFGQDPLQIADFMQSLGYKGTLLAVDHEEHWFYEPK